MEGTKRLYSNATDKVGTQSKRIPRKHQNPRDNDLPLITPSFARVGLGTKRIRRINEKPTVKDLPLRVPIFAKEGDLGEIKRLMKRKLPPHVTNFHEGAKYSCAICFDKVHLYCDCPYLKKMPPRSGVEPGFDKACLECGRIGLNCCSKGTYAVPKMCYLCCHPGHWSWEDRCPKKYSRGPYLDGIWNSIKKSIEEEDDLMVNPWKMKERNKEVDVLKDD